MTGPITFRGDKKSHFSEQPPAAEPVKKLALL